VFDRENSAEAAGCSRWLARDKAEIAGARVSLVTPLTQPRIVWIHVTFRQPSAPDVGMADLALLMIPPPCVDVRGHRADVELRADGLSTPPRPVRRPTAEAMSGYRIAAHLRCGTRVNDNTARGRARARPRGRQVQRPLRQRAADDAGVDTRSHRTQARIHSRVRE
jgi:hypothetical protein